jgi:hypothetical protein
MTDVELKFRHAENELDTLMLTAKPGLTDEGVTISDWSARNYHYQNERLSWNYWFEKKRPRDSEILKLSVHVSLTEEAPTTVKVRTSSEIFQIGKKSHWSTTTNGIISLDDAVRCGLTHIVMSAIREGTSAAEAAR